MKKRSLKFLIPGFWNKIKIIFNLEFHVYIKQDYSRADELFSKACKASIHAFGFIRNKLIVE